MLNFYFRKTPEIIVVKLSWLKEYMIILQYLTYLSK